VHLIKFIEFLYSSEQFTRSVLAEKFVFSVVDCFVVTHAGALVFCSF
jgi:hypothetical protein